MHIVLESCYTKCLKTFFGYHKYMYSSVTGMLMELGIPSFSRPALIHKYYSSFHNRLKTFHILVNVKHIAAFNSCSFLVVVFLFALFFLYLSVHLSVLLCSGSCGQIQINPLLFMLLHFFSIALLSK